MLGKRIANLRKKSGLSQAELARRLDVTASAIGMYEQGRRAPSHTTLIALAKEFGVSIDYLLSGEQQQSFTFPVETPSLWCAHCAELLVAYLIEQTI